MLGFNPKTLNVGDKAYYMRSGRYGGRSSAAQGVVVKITSSGQITVETRGANTLYYTRFLPTGAEIGGGLYLIDAETFARISADNERSARAVEVRYAVDKAQKTAEYISRGRGGDVDAAELVIALEEALRLAKAL